MEDASFISPQGLRGAPSPQQTPLDYSKTLDWRTTQRPIWEPLTKRMSSQGFTRKVKEKDLFFQRLSIVWHWAKRYGVLVASGKTSLRWSVRQQLDTCVAPGHPWELPLRWVIHPGSKWHCPPRARTVKRWQTEWLPPWIIFAVKKRHYPWFHERVISWTETILFIVILLQKTLEPVLEMCSSQSLSLSLHFLTKKRNENNAKSSEWLFIR